MRGKIVRGSDMRGLLHYLVGPGEENEHTNPHVVAASVNLPVWTVSGPTGVMETLTGDEAKAIADEIDEPRRAHGKKVPWIDPRKKAKALVQAEQALGPGSTDKQRELWARDQARVPDANVWHCALSLHVDEGELGDAKWGPIARDFMAMMGFDTDADARASWVAVHHGRSAGGNDHIHIAASLVREDGSLVNLWPMNPATGKGEGDGPRSSQAIQELERRYGLRIDRDEGAASPSYARAEVALAQKATGKSRKDVVARSEVVKHQLARWVRAHATAAEDESDFAEALAGDPRLLARPRLKEGGVVGYSVALLPTGRSKNEYRDSGEAIFYGGTTLGRDLGLGELRKGWRQPVAGDEVGYGEAVALWRLIARDPERAQRRAGVPREDDTDDRDLERIRETLARWADDVGEIRAGDAESAARAAQLTAGVFAALSVRFEVSEPGTLADGARIFARTATRRYSAARPRSARSASASRAAAHALRLTTGSGKESKMWAALVEQLAATARAISAANEAAGNAAAAQRMALYMRELVAAGSERVGDVSLIVPAAAAQLGDGDVWEIPIHDGQNAEAVEMDRLEHRNGRGLDEPDRDDTGIDGAELGD